MSNAIKTEQVKTRKIHRCFGCCREIPAGKIVQRDTWVDMGTIQSTYLCDVCVQVSDLYLEYDDSYGEGELISNFPSYYQAHEQECR